MYVNWSFHFELLIQFLKQEAMANGLGDISKLSMIIDPDRRSIAIINQEDTRLDELAEILDTDLDGLLEHLAENPDILELREETYGLPSSASDRERAIGPSWSDCSLIRKH